MKKIQNTFCIKENISGIIWGYVEHYSKEAKGKITYYICFSNQESLENILLFYVNRIQQKLSAEIVSMLKRNKIK